MSVETKETLRKAIAEHVEDETGGYLIDWVLVTAELDQDDITEDTTGHLIVSGDDTSGYKQRGLLDIGLQFNRRDIRSVNDD